MWPNNIEQKIFKCVPLSLGHLGVDKCSEEIKYVFYIKDLGRKLSKFIACCDVCQKSKHLNRSVDVKVKQHFPKKPDAEI